MLSKSWQSARDERAKTAVLSLSLSCRPEDSSRETVI